jgi:hypothetical protein
MLTGLSLRVSPCALSTQTTSKEEPLEYLHLKRCTVLNHRTANHSGNRIFGNRNRTSICTNQDARIRLQRFEEKMLQGRSRCSRTQSTSRMKSALYWSTTTSEQNRKDAAKEYDNFDPVDWRHLGKSPNLSLHSTRTLIFINECLLNYTCKTPQN